MVLGIVVARSHPGILSALRRKLPVLDLGFWVVARKDERLPPETHDGA
jgi:hypothetical protein